MDSSKRLCSLKVFTHNFNPSSNSGPNKFSRQLFRTLIGTQGVTVTNEQNAADVEFCLIQQQVHKVKPMMLRLDGIYFNSEQAFNEQNAPIKFAYNNADVVVFQSEFNKKLTENWFGPHKNGVVIHNASDSTLFDQVNTDIWNQVVDPTLEVWSCASSWRPHKRLADNVRYFLEFAPLDAVLMIAGKDAQSYLKNIKIPDSRSILYVGELNYPTLLSLYKRSSTFIHLSYLDHCPNVVVDAQAAGCFTICSSTGGTSEIVSNGKVILEQEWDYKPCELYNPPIMNFSNSTIIKNKSNLKFEKCVKTYYDLLNELLKEIK